MTSNTKIIKKQFALQLLSFACMLHCIITPLLLFTVPLLGQYFSNFWVELSFMAVSIACGIIVIRSGYCLHKKAHTLIIFGLGIALWVLHSCFEYFEISGAKVYLFTGLLLVIGSYYINHHQLKCCLNCKK